VTDWSRAGAASDGTPLPCRTGKTGRKIDSALEIDNLIDHKTIQIK
jgi:hypothetical protein